MHQAPQDLYDAAFAVLNHSYSPYSNYKVACALRSQDGEIFSGCNVENASYSVVLCAEASALGTMVSQGQRLITEVLIIVDDKRVASPCGSCRQRLFELSSADTVVHMCTTSHQYEQARLHDLLPLAFELER
jgi:cytidine deaminase